MTEEQKLAEKKLDNQIENLDEILQTPTKARRAKAREMNISAKKNKSLNSAGKIVEEISEATLARSQMDLSNVKVPKLPECEVLEIKEFNLNGGLSISDDKVNCKVADDEFETFLQDFKKDHEQDLISEGHPIECKDMLMDSPKPFVFEDDDEDDNADIFSSVQEFEFQSLEEDKARQEFFSELENCS